MAKKEGAKQPDNKKGAFRAAYACAMCVLAVVIGTCGWLGFRQMRTEPDATDPVSTRGTSATLPVIIRPTHTEETEESEWTQATEPVTQPFEPTTEPSEPTMVPTEPTTVPTEPTTVPTEPTTVPTEPTTVPTEPTTVPTEPTTVPTEPTTVPTESTAVPTEPITEPTEPSETIDPDAVILKLKEFSEPVVLIGDAAKAYMDAADPGFVSDFLRPYWGKERLDVGHSVELEFYAIHLPKGIKIDSARFVLYEDGEAFRTLHTTGGCSVQVDCLKAGTHYDYQVFIRLTNGTEHILDGSFQTAAYPRILSIDGLVNVRDFGGWRTLDGKTIRQGILYRGSTMDGVYEPEFKLTEKGLNQMKALLGIRVDMDLRASGEDALGEDVPHLYFGAYQYSLAFTEDGMAAIRRVFEALADPDNYPAYLHCTYGADRTGTICYLLGAVLGMSDRDLMREYELSALQYWYICSEDMALFVEEIGKYPGNDTCERVENFLFSAGVTQQQLDSIRQIFLEDP